LHNLGRPKRANCHLNGGKSKSNDNCAQLADLGNQKQSQRFVPSFLRFRWLVVVVVVVMTVVTCYCRQLKTYAQHPQTPPNKNTHTHTTHPFGLHKLLFDNVKVPRKQIKKHIEIGLMYGGSQSGCESTSTSTSASSWSGVLVSLAAVCFTGFNPKIKRELSIKICDPFRGRLPLQRRDADCCFKIKTSCALEKHTGKEQRTKNVGVG